MKHLNITFENNSNIICNLEPVVISEEHISFTKGGETIGTVKATFDFSELPKEMHEMAINLLRSQRQNICMPRY